MRATLLTMALLPLLAAAQSWCPPGATWTYGIEFPDYYGYYSYIYSGDTVLAGSAGKRLSIFGETSVISTGQVTSTYTVAACVTRQSADLVEIWDDENQAWDTLYWYGAFPGSSWKRPFDSGTCGSDERVFVLDTGHVVIEGLQLAYWDVEQQWEDGVVGPIRIIERLGNLQELLFMLACYSGDDVIGLRCYSDNEITVNYTPFPCTSLVGIEDVLRKQDPVPFPNPGTDHFTLSLPPGPHTITLFDATGRMALLQSTAEERPVISTEGLPTGMYMMRIVDRNGSTHHYQWIKS